MPRKRTKKTLLVLVHPGSACGSANMNLGKQLAGTCRDILAADLATWNGPIVVIDGDLSDELPFYPRLDTAIKGALKRARSAKKISSRIWGCDNIGRHQNDAITAYVSRRRLKPTDWHMEVTGCWTTRGEKDHGCVDGVFNTLRNLGFSAQIRDSAVEELPDDED